MFKAFFRKRCVSAVSVLMLFFAAAVLVQWLSGAFGNDFGGHSDEPAHFVTGLWFHDLLLSRDWFRPLHFTEQYYLHYPKVAIGHWGPVFYFIQGCWQMGFGSSRASLLLLMAAITAGLAALLYGLARRHSSLPVAVACGMGLVLSPTFQQYTASLMTEPLSSLWLFAAAIGWGRFLEDRNMRYSIAFGAFAALAILTKGTGLLLAAVPPLTVLLLREFSLLRRFTFWLPAILVLIACGPWYVLTLELQRNGMESESFSLGFVSEAFPFYSLAATGIVGLAFGLWSLVGVFGWRRLEQPGSRGLWAAMLALTIAVLGFHTLVPCGLEERHLAPAIAPLLLFAAAGIEYVGVKLTGLGVARTVGTAAVAAASLAALCLEAGLGHAMSNRGFSAIGRDLDRLLPDRDGAMLIASDELGDGMIVAAVAMHDDRPGRFALRASKSLASSRWSGRGHRLRFQTPEEVAAWLTEVPVGLVVIDDTVDSAPRPEHEQLRQALSLHAARWQVLAVYPVTRAGRTFPRGLRVYRQACPQGYSVTSLEVGLEEMLGRTIRLEGEGRDGRRLRK